MFGGRGGCRNESLRNQQFDVTCRMYGFFLLMFWVYWAQITHRFRRFEGCVETISHTASVCACVSKKYNRMVGIRKALVNP